MDGSALFNGKRITVIGLGLLGRGVGDIRYLASCGADLIVTDLKTEEDLKESLEALSEFSNIRYTLGKHERADFEDRDLIVNGPAVPLESPYLAHARERNIPITMSAALFARHAREAGARVIGITGTRGKTTTTYLIAEILKHAGKTVLIGGNVPNTSTLALLPQVTKDTIAVLELDSWQLQGFNEEKLSPHVAVFTTFFPDHMNYYQDDLDLYLRDKATIFLYQTEADTLVLGQQVAPMIIEKYGEHIASRVVIAVPTDVPQDWELVMPGEHNRYAAAVALRTARTLGVADEISREALESFVGVPGRLELVAVKDGVSFYNDTTATTPEATIAALHALGADGGKRVVLIAGGNDKGLAMDGLLAIIPETAKHIALLAGSGTDRIKGALPEAQVFSSLEEAFDDARAHAEEGDMILFSPAFASFGMFKNEYDRGNAFMRLVEAL